MQKERIVEKILPTPTPDVTTEVFEENVLLVSAIRGVSKESTTETLT